MKLLFRILIFAFVLQSAEAYSWGTTGHRTIAEIAEHHLTNKSKRKLRKFWRPKIGVLCQLARFCKV
jgi:hypothetical protein